MEFRKLTKDEIDVRVQSVNDYKRVELLIYKNARVDMDLLDETVGVNNWKREHANNNSNCIVSIWDKDKSQWVSKEDVGKPSNKSREKGLASDSFKRACINWGIGRELYTAPRISIESHFVNIKKQKEGSGYTTYDKFIVKHIEYTGNKISELEIYNKSKGVVCFKYPYKEIIEKAPTKKEMQLHNFLALVEQTSTDIEAICQNYGKEFTDDLTEKDIENATVVLKKKLEKIERQLQENIPLPIDELRKLIYEAGYTVVEVVEPYKKDRLEELTDRQKVDIAKNCKYQIYINNIKEQADGKRK